jgi:TonB family protein
MFLNQLSFFKLWLLSLAIHVMILVVFFVTENSEVEKIKFHLTEGSSLSLFSRSYLTRIGIGKQNDEAMPQDTAVGTKIDERDIDMFKNSLTYPELAVEQGLEDDCLFRVTVAENGQVEKLVVIAPCKYNVFDSQIRSQLRMWKFNFSRGKDLVLPIRFRIHDRESTH